MQLPQLVLEPGRKCGRCTACCTALEITELKKPANTKCPHQDADGCSIHDTSPPSCQGFFCAWRLGYFTDSDRPDRVNVLFSLRFGTKFSAGPLLIVDELQPGTSLQPRPHALILQESTRQLVLIRTYNPDGKGERKLVGPIHELDRVQPLVDDVRRRLHGRHPQGTSTNNPGLDEVS